MEGCPDQIVDRVGGFNRFYSAALGIFNNHILESPFSLTEARILYEIGNTSGCTATRLTELLGVDPGYLSRIIRRFESRGLIRRNRSTADGRLHFLHLTEAGYGALQALVQRADDQVRRMLNRVPGRKLAELVHSMDVIESILSSPQKDDDRITMRAHRPGDIGHVISRHGILYEKEYGFDLTFVMYVAEGLVEFLRNFNEETDRLWLAECGGRTVGSIGVVGRENRAAQLRWFLVEPEFRGRGLGRRLLQQAMDFCREKGFQQVYLWTFDALDAARHLYQAFGFVPGETVSHHIWGQDLTEERWKKSLS